MENNIIVGNFAGDGRTANDVTAPNYGIAFNNLVGILDTSGGSLGSGFSNGTNGNQVGVTNPGLGALGYYGGPTQTIPLLPGSPAIDAGNNAYNTASADQRGDARVVNGTVDIGAFESQGFTLIPIRGSTPQTAARGAAFANPLGVTVASNDGVSPVVGGTINFAANPAAGGATATLSAATATIGSNGQASVTVTANGTAGSYTVTASASGVPSPATFSLANLAPPTANAQSVGVAFNTVKPITLTGSDPAGQPLTYAVAANPAHGTLSGFNATTGAVTYTPTAGYHGSDSFTFTVSDGTYTSAAAAVTLTVATGTPTANAQALGVSFNTARAITLTGSDADNPSLTLTYAILSGPSHGTLSGSAPNLTYTPAAGYHGADSFTFTVNNGTNTSSAAAVTLTVATGTPTANPQSAGVGFNTAKAITLTGSDPDSPALSLTYAVGTGPAHGTLSGFNAATGAVTYTPAAGYHGSDSFTFTANNGTNTSSPATVTLTVATGTPTANPQAASVAFNTAKAITLTGSDPDSPALTLTYTVTANPTHGTLSGFNSATGSVT